MLVYQVNDFVLGGGEFAQLSTLTRAAIDQFDLAIPKTEVASFDAAVVVGLSAAVHPLALWDQLSLWLRTDAVVVLVALQKEPTPRMQHWLKYVEAIGARCGFVAQELRRADVEADTQLFYRSANPRWQLRHVRPKDFGEIATLFLEVFGHPLSRLLWEWKYARGRGNAVVAARNGALMPLFFSTVA